jgi:hypothetical protein
VALLSLFDNSITISANKCFFFLTSFFILGDGEPNQVRSQLLRNRLPTASAERKLFPGLAKSSSERTSCARSCEFQRSRTIIRFRRSRSNRLSFIIIHSLAIVSG